MEYLFTMKLAGDVALPLGVQFIIFPSIKVDLVYWKSFKSVFKSAWNEFFENFVYREGMFSMFGVFRFGSLASSGILSKLNSVIFL